MNRQRRLKPAVFALLALTALLAWSGLVVTSAQARRGSSMEQVASDLRTTWPDLHFTIEEEIAEGD
jgi:hypothetical protein